MKKILSLFAAVLFAGSMMAEAQVDLQYAGTTSVNMAGDGANNAELVGLDATMFTVLSDKGKASNHIGLNKAGDIRLYAHKDSGNGCTLTVSIAEGKILSIVLDIKQTATFEVKAGENVVTEEGGSYAINASSFSIKNTTTGASTQLQLNKITITHDGEGGGGVPVVYDTLTVAEAKTLAQELADKATSAEKYYVEGYAVNVDAYSVSYGNQIFFMVDDVNAPDSLFEAYAAYPTKDGKAYPVLAGDKVRAFGALKKFGTQLEIDHPTVEFITEVEGDRTIEQPAEAEVITVTKALEIGTALESGKTTTEYYEVQGYVTALTDNKGVANADGGWAQYKNQCMWIADAKDGGTTKETAFFVYQGVASEQVTKGAKISIKCQLKNYNGMVENAAAKAAVTILEKGEEPTPVDPTPATLDTIDVAKALEIGETLENGKATDVQYVIKGYSSVIKTAYDPGYKSESFWIVDEKGSKAASNADGAFLVFRGKPDTEKSVGIGALVYVTAKIQKYSDGVIESWSNCAVHVEEQGGEETVESINVTKALEIGNALADKAVSPEKYEITGYVSHIYSFFSKDFNNETVWISDDPENTTTENAFEIYRGRPNTAAEVGWGAKVKIVCQIKNYGGTIENDGTNLPFEVLEASTFVPDTLSIEEAVDIANALGEDAKTPKYHVIKGFIQDAPLPYNYKGSDNKWKNTTIKMSQFPNEQEGPLAVYKANILKADTAKLVQNSYAYVLGYLTKHGGAQVAEGSNVEFVEAPQMDTIHCTVAEAIAAGKDLPEGGKSNRIYAVTGFVNEIISDFTEGLQSFYMAETAESKDESFFAQDAKIAAAAAEGNKVELVGRLQNAGDGIIVVENGQARIIGAEGIENVVLTEKVQKVVVDGAIYIIRDNKMFDIRGTQVR